MKAASQSIQRVELKCCRVGNWRVHKGSSSWTWACPELLGCTEMLWWQDGVRRKVGEEAPSHFQEYRGCPLASNPSQKCFRRTCCYQLLISPICCSNFPILPPSWHRSCPMFSPTISFTFHSLGTGTHASHRDSYKKASDRQGNGPTSTGGQDKCLDRYHPKCLVSTEGGETVSQGTLATDSLAPSSPRLEPLDTPLPHFLTNIAITYFLPGLSPGSTETFGQAKLP